jgi:hypothetical protein
MTPFLDTRQFVGYLFPFSTMKLFKILISTTNKKACRVIFSPLSRQCKKTTLTSGDDTLLLGGDFSMAKKGQQFQRYTDEFKLNAVLKYINGSKSYKVMAEELGIQHCTQLKVWVKSGKMDNHLT